MTNASTAIFSPGATAVSPALIDIGINLTHDSYDSDRDAVREWVCQPDHVEVQRMAGELYTDMWVQTAETYREARLIDGQPVDVDLTHLFLER